MLEEIRALIDTRSVIAGVVGLVVGWLVGWMLFGWVIWPVSWTNADPPDLRRTQKEVYVAMVADSYSVDFDRELVDARLRGFEKDEIKEILLSSVQERAGEGDTEGTQRLRRLAAVLGMTLEEAVPTPQPAPQPAAARVVSLLRSFLPVCGALLIVLIIVAVIAIVVSRFLTRPAEAPREVVSEEPVLWEVPGEAALGRFVTTYRLGDDGYDTSFNVETAEPEREFLGACGVGFSETIGEGSPDKIVAFEIWIFDKIDLDNVQTVTKVLVSEFAYHDEELRAKLRDRGELVLAEKGKTTVIEAMRMKLNVEVVDFAYGSDPSLPPRSYFETLTTELVPVVKT